MEELHYSWYFYTNHDIRILPNHLRWSIGAYDNGNFFIVDFLQKKINAAIFLRVITYIL